MKYAKQLPLRLYDEEVQELESLKENLKMTSETAVIRHIISNYRKLKKDLSDQESKRKTAETELASLKNSLRDFFGAFNKLNDIIKR